MRVLHVCSEVYPLLQTGGLAHVTAALPAALAKPDSAGRLLLPGFPAVLAGLSDLREVVNLNARFGAHNVRLLLGHLPNGLPAYVIEAPELYQRPGNPYADAYHNAYADNDRRFALL